MQVKSITECSKAILLTVIKLPFVIKIFVLSILEWPLRTGFTVLLLFVVGVKSYVFYAIAYMFEEIGHVNRNPSNMGKRAIIVGQECLQIQLNFLVQCSYDQNPPNAKAFSTVACYI